MYPLPNQTVVRAWAALISALLFAGLALAPQEAEAHARLVRSDPPAETRLARPPAMVRLWFSEPLERAFAKAWITDSAGTKYDKLAKNVTDPKMLQIDLPAIPPGTYTVRFRVLSVDGHVVEGTFVFTVNPRPE